MVHVLLKVRTLWRLLKWRASFGRFNLDSRPDTANPKFMTARDAVRLIPDNACVMSTGMTGTMRPAILYRAVRVRFAETGHPKNLTWVTAGGAGGRGRVPGTVEEVGVAGLTTRFISGHLETARSLLDLGERGQCMLSVLPQGTIAHLAEAQARGEDSVLTKVGVGSFMDPRVGAGSQVVPGVGEQLVTPEGDKLRYRMPPVTAACVIGTMADDDGNIYMTDAGILAETREAARAARKNDGVVICTVARITPRDDAQIFLHTEEVDAIVVNATNELSATIPQLKPWRELLPGSKADVNAATLRIKMLNDLMKLDPARGPVQQVLARQAASLFSHTVRPGSKVIVGYGLPQEVGRQIERGGLSHDITFLLETGVYGGIPAPGIFFGLAVNPERLMSSAEMFRYCETNLDATILGALQVDSDGNVNVSKKAPGAKNYIGPGGFLNLVASAKTIIFVGAFTARGRIEIVDGKLLVKEAGTPKFVERVDEVTFAAKEAYAAGKKVYYVTPLGTFRLTARGLELFEIAPGVDVERDIKANSRATIHLPESTGIEVIDSSVITGRGFSLRWGTR